MIVLPGLSKSLARIGQVPVVVVTDRYPPHAFGGAEVSLHIFLQSLGDPEGILVVSLGDDNLVPKVYEVDGVQVLMLPRPGKWPLQSMPHALAKGLDVITPEARRRLTTAPAAATLTLAQRLPSSDRQMLFESLSTPAPRGGVVSDFAEFETSAAVRSLREVFRRCQPKLVHADNCRSILLTAIASRGLDLRLVGVVRDNRFQCVRHDQSMQVAGRHCSECKLECAEVDAPRSEGLQRRMLERSREFRSECLSAMDRVVVTSSFLESQIQTLLPDAKLVRIANTPDDYETALEHMEGVAELPGTNLLVIGMLNENKGQIGLVRHLAALVERVPDAVVHFAGRGPRIERRLREISAEAGLADRIVFHGQVERAELYALLRQSQVVVLPTRWPEPFGRVPLEAAIAERPVVAFGVGGLPESIVEGETGYIVGAERFEALIQRIAELAEDPMLRRRMGRKAREHVLAHYRVEQLQNQVCALWHDLIGAHAPTPRHSGVSA